MFSAFIGIDWSGAKGRRHAGIQMAHANSGQAVPRRIEPTGGKHWSRHELFNYLCQLVELPSGPVLVGIDFAFAHPFVDAGSYFPSVADAPPDAAALWALIDRVNADQPHLYGGGMFRQLPWADFYLAPPHYKAPHYASRRRMTEIAARHSGRSPSPTFKAVGADNVATGSLAGMRLLHQLKTRLGDRLAVWPFDLICPAKTKLVLVEIFPSLYFHRLGMVPAKQAAADPQFLNQALQAYASQGVDADFIPLGKDADEADAIISAAALRWFAADESIFTPAGLKRPPQALAAQQEGWIFGVPMVGDEEPIYRDKAPCAYLINLSSDYPLI